MHDFAADLAADHAAIAALTRQTASYLRNGGVDDRAIHHVGLVLDELLTNVAVHNSAGARASVRMKIAPARISVELIDSGSIFDPRLGRNADVTADIDGPVGGLGLMLVHRLADDLEYGRVGERNRTTFTIRRLEAGRQEEAGARHGTG